MMGAERKDFDHLCRAGEIFGPVDASAIAQAEAELGVQFPSEYQELLGKYGAVLAGNIEVYGLPKGGDNDPPLWQHVVTVTKQLRDCGQVCADRQHFVPICDDGSGIYFCLDASESPGTKIYAVGPGVDQIYNSSLYRFLLDLSKGTLAPILQLL